MPAIFSAVRGMKDILPNQSLKWQNLEAQLITHLQSYGYQNIRIPIVEKSSVFSRTIGEITDIVAKELYTWRDKNDDNLSLRPEGTAGVARAMVEHNLVREQVQKVWYLGPMFRRERPQKGRYRQFFQFGAEAFGISEPKIEAELIQISNELWQILNLKNMRLELNSLGSTKCRKSHKKELITYLKDHQNQLDKDSIKRLNTNPLRILDSKNPALKSIIDEAPKILNYLDTQARNHFDTLLNYLANLGINYTINPNLVRGLDYYNQTVFEWMINNNELGSQSTICAGGRYDYLTEQLGGKPTAAAGFAIGLERLLLCVKNNVKTAPMVYIISQSTDAHKLSLLLSSQLRQAMPEIIIYNNSQNLSIKAQFKKADKQQADIAIILAEDELKTQQVSIKPLKSKQQQITIKQSQLITILKKLL